MNFVRLVFATLLGLLAVLLVVGDLLLIRNHVPTHLLEQLWVFGFALCLAASAYYCTCSRARWDARLRCSRCQQAGSLRLSPLGQPRLSVGAWILGGLIGSLLYSHARKHRFHCESCGKPCEARTAGGWLAAAWLLLLVLALALEGFL